MFNSNWFCSPKAGLFYRLLKHHDQRWPRNFFKSCLCCSKTLHNFDVSWRFRCNLWIRRLTIIKNPDWRLFSKIHSFKHPYFSCLLFMVLFLNVTENWFISFAQNLLFTFHSCLSMHFESGINLRQPFSKNCYLTFIDLTIRSILDNELGMRPIHLTLEK